MKLPNSLENLLKYAEAAEMRWPRAVLTKRHRYRMRRVLAPLYPAMYRLPHYLIEHFDLPNEGFESYFNYTHPGFSAALRGILRQ